MIDSDRIVAIEARCAAATPEPWQQRDTADYAEIHTSDTWGKSLTPIALVSDCDDAAFIANARADLPWSVEQIKALTDEVKRLRDAQRTLWAEFCELLEAQRWIPVQGRLPEPNVRVEAYRPDMIDSDVGPFSIVWGWTCKNKVHGVSHWRLPVAPLPAAPEEGE